MIFFLHVFLIFSVAGLIYNTTPSNEYCSCFSLHILSFSRSLDLFTRLKWQLYLILGKFISVIIFICYFSHSVNSFCLYSSANFGEAILLTAIKPIVHITPEDEESQELQKNLTKTDCKVRVISQIKRQTSEMTLR